MLIPTKSIIRIEDLLLRTIIGFNAWERDKKQDVQINLYMEFDAKKAVETDRVEDTLDYKKIKKSVITLVESSCFNLLETLAHRILETVASDEKVIYAEVKVDKLHALRFARSVSVEMQFRR